MSSPFFPRLTPVVGRIIAVTAVAQLLLETVFTSPGVVAALQFTPAMALSQPWTILSYMFVHAGLLHLASNMFGLYVFGSAVESRMGGRPFLVYYLVCGIGAALFAMVLSMLRLPSPAFLGASGAVLGTAVAFAMLWPNEEFILFPLPITVRAWTLVMGLAAIDIVFALLRFNDGVAHLAHIGGMLFGYVFFRAQAFTSGRSTPKPRRVEQVVMVQTGGGHDDHPSGTPASRRLATPRGDALTAEVDRVLDKISEKGLASLTPEERRFLDEVSKRKRELN